MILIMRGDITAKNTRCLIRGVGARINELLDLMSAPTRARESLGITIITRIKKGNETAIRFGGTKKLE